MSSALIPFGSRDGSPSPRQPLRYTGGTPSATASVLDDCLERLEVVLVEEVAALNQASQEALQSLNLRKSTLLLELDRRMRDMRGNGVTVATRDRLKRIKSLLEENLRLLSLHLAAVNEIVAIIRQSVERAEADGTYSKSLAWDEWSR